MLWNGLEAHDIKKGQKVANICLALLFRVRRPLDISLDLRRQEPWDLYLSKTPFQ